MRNLFKFQHLLLKNKNISNPNTLRKIFLQIYQLKQANIDEVNTRRGIMHYNV
jgi:hypothetical protein